MAHPNRELQNPAPGTQKTTGLFGIQESLLRTGQV
jgi:hypothetical protein